MKKSILITGTNGSLAYEIFKKINNSGLTAIIHLRNSSSRIEKLVKKNLKNSIKIVYGDITNNSTITKLTKLIKFNKTNVLINNCGIYLNKPFMKMTKKEIKKIFDVNFFSNIFLLKSLLSKGSKKLFIVNINSIAGIYGSANETLYSASKHALKGFYDSFEKENKKRISILNIYPGAFKSKMTKNRDDYKKLMCPKEIADIILNNLKNYETCSLSEIYIKRKLY